MDICATSDGGAALIVSSVEYAKRMGKGDAPRVAAISTVTPKFASEIVEMPDIATDSAAARVDFTRAADGGILGGETETERKDDGATQTHSVEVVSTVFTVIAAELVPVFTVVVF